MRFRAPRRRALQTVSGVGRSHARRPLRRASATYKYYNMDQVVAPALTRFAKIAGVRRAEWLA